MTLAEAVKVGGTDRAGIQKGLGKVNVKLPIGPIAFDDHHQAHPDLYVLAFASGGVKLIRSLHTGS
jgi:branched-chain amino acid transport system substrate-binding protein